MNRNNIWIHIGLATVLIVLAAVVGQIERWKSALRVNAPEIKRVSQPNTKQRSGEDRPELLVRFKPGVGLDRIRAIAAANHDEVSDEIEAVSGLTEINDLDDADAAATASQ